MLDGADVWDSGRIGGGRTGQIYRLHDFVCLWAEHEKKLLFLHCIPLSFSPMCPPPFHLPRSARRGENTFQMGWLRPHGEDVVVRSDCSPGPVQTCIIRRVWTWVIFWETGSGAAARKVGDGRSAWVDITIITVKALMSAFCPGKFTFCILGF